MPPSKDTAQQPSLTASNISSIRPTPPFLSSLHISEGSTPTSPGSPTLQPKEAALQASKERVQARPLREASVNDENLDVEQVISIVKPVGPIPEQPTSLVPDAPYAPSRTRSFKPSAIAPKVLEDKAGARSVTSDRPVHMDDQDVQRQLLRRTFQQSLDKRQNYPFKLTEYETENSSNFSSSVSKNRGEAVKKGESSLKWKGSPGIEAILQHNHQQTVNAPKSEDKDDKTPAIPFSQFRKPMKAGPDADGNKFVPICPVDDDSDTDESDWEIVPPFSPPMSPFEEVNLVEKPSIQPTLLANPTYLNTQVCCEPWFPGEITDCVAMLPDPEAVHQQMQHQQAMNRGMSKGNDSRHVEPQVVPSAHTPTSVLNTRARNDKTPSHINQLCTQRDKSIQEQAAIKQQLERILQETETSIKNVKAHVHPIMHRAEDHDGFLRELGTHLEESHHVGQPAQTLEESMLSQLTIGPNNHTEHPRPALAPQNVRVGTAASQIQPVPAAELNRDTPALNDLTKALVAYDKDEIMAEWWNSISSQSIALDLYPRNMYHFTHNRIQLKKEPAEEKWWWSACNNQYEQLGAFAREYSPRVGQKERGGFLEFVNKESGQALGKGCV